MDEIAVLHEKIMQDRGQDAMFHDENDPEVDRLFNSSPPLLELVPTYELDSFFGLGVLRGEGGEDEDDKSDNVEEFSHEKEMEQDYTALSPPRSLPHEAGQAEVMPANDSSITSSTPPTPTPIEFEHVEITSPANKSSALTSLLLKSSSVPLQEANTLQLTFYLPDYSAIKVSTGEAATFGMAVAKVLALHKEKGLQPVLAYDKPNMYEVCMHEGDGEPDRDFIFQKSHKIKNYYNASRPSVNEYCLCETEEAFRASIKARGSHCRSRADTIDQLANLPENMVIVVVPSGRGKSADENLVLPFSSTTSMRDLLPLIAEQRRINLLTGHFSFKLSHEDQIRLKYTSTLVGLECLVGMVGARKFELERKQFDDASKVNLGERVNFGSGAVGKASSTVSAKGYGTRGRFSNHGVINENDGVDDGRESVVVAQNHEDNLDATPLAAFTTMSSAAAYQEWQIIKKNKLGIKQPRVLGIDGKFIYNYKRGERRGSSGVTTATREIRKIIRVTSVAEDPKVLRITFDGEGLGFYDIEYICERVEDRAEIVGKLKYLGGKA